MKYRIELAGRGGEIAIGTVKREVYDYFDENGIDIEEYAGDWDNEQGVPEEFQPFEPGSWYDCDDLCHNCGPALDDCYITVTDENDNVIHDAVSAGEMMELGMDYNSEEIYPEHSMNDGDVYFIGQSIEKGLFQVYEFEAESFDPTKLLLQVEDCDGWELVTGASYNDVSLDDLGELSTTGKGAEFQLILVEKD
jgi:hypothetical protein